MFSDECLARHAVCSNPYNTARITRLLAHLHFAGNMSTHTRDASNGVLELLALVFLSARVSNQGCASMSHKKSFPAYTCTHTSCQFQASNRYCVFFIETFRGKRIFVYKILRISVLLGHEAQDFRQNTT